MSNRDASLFAILGVIGLDSSSKEAAIMYLDGSLLPVLPFFNLTLGFNRGVSFGMFSAEGAAGWWGLVLATLVISMILGGALGNLVDRLPDGAVTDFIDLHAGGWHFPTFNLADVGITAGVLLLLLSSLLPARVKTA